MKTVFEITHHADAHPVIKVFETLPVRIGRAYDNDVILQDPYVSPYHAVVDYNAAEDRLSLTDLGSDNGIVWKNDTATLGQTEIRFFDASRPVAATLKIDRQHPVLEILRKPSVVWLIYLATVAASAGWTYLEVWSDETASAVSIGALTVATIILLWSAAWSLIGRVTRHRAMFTGHLLIGSIYVFVSSLLMVVQNYVNFAANENIFAKIFDYAVVIVTMAPLIYGALSLATVMQKRQRMIASGLFAAGIVAGTILFGFVGQKSFDQAPHYPPTLEPYLTNILPAKPLASFTAANKKIFESKIFESDKQK